MKPEVSPTPRGESTSLSDEVIQVHMMRELFTRTRESALLGFAPVFLLAWAHWDAQPVRRLAYWTGSVLLALTYRLLVAHLFLVKPQAQSERCQRWFVLEWVGAVVLAGAWVSCITLLGSGEIDALFYLRLIFLVGLVSFLLSALGIDLRLYASFIAVVEGGGLMLLDLFYPRFVAELPMVTTGFMVYGLMLLVRSRGEHRRTQEWVRARLTQRLLLDQLNQTMHQEQQMHEALRAKSLELEATNRQLSELAIYDGLTGAYRRGHIEGELRRLVKSMQRKHSEFSVMLLDIDYFKNVNDRYGHAVGDEVLRRMAALVQETLRSSDLFGRWGGEEFIVLMPETAMVDALGVAERVREVVRTLEFTGEKYRMGITVSIGVAQLQPAETADMLVPRADQALYAAKHSGRDRVMAHAPDRSLFSSSMPSGQSA